MLSEVIQSRLTSVRPAILPRAVLSGTALQLAGPFNDGPITGFSVIRCSGDPGKSEGTMRGKDGKEALPHSVALFENFQYITMSLSD